MACHFSLVRLQYHSTGKSGSVVHTGRGAGAAAHNSRCEGRHVQAGKAPSGGTQKQGQLQARKGASCDSDSHLVVRMTANQAGAMATNRRNNDEFRKTSSFFFSKMHIHPSLLPYPPLGGFHPSSLINHSHVSLSPSTPLTSLASAMETSPPLSQSHLIPSLATNLGLVISLSFSIPLTHLSSPIRLAC